MNVFWFQTRVRTSARPVVVLDASAAAEPLWPVLQSTVEGLAEVLPASARPDVAFLGGSERVPLDKFTPQADALYAANKGRGRVVSPLLESFRDGWPSRVVVLAAKPVVDLPDWKVTPHARRLAVVRLDPSGSVSGGAFPEADLTDMDALAKLVHQPPVGLRVRVRGGIPVAWDNPAYRFSDGRLEADPAAAGDVRAGFLTPEDHAAPVAEFVRADGTTDRLPVEPADPPAEAGWLPVSSAELTWLHSWQAGRPAHCPRCGNDHPPGEVACPDGDGALLPSLAKLPPGGFARVRVKMFQGSHQPAPNPVLVIDGPAVVVRAPADAPPAVWRFDPGREEWRPTADEWGLFERVGDDEFALALPPVRREAAP